MHLWFLSIFRLLTSHHLVMSPLFGHSLVRLHKLRIATSSVQWLKSSEMLVLDIFQGSQFGS